MSKLSYLPSGQLLYVERWKEEPPSDSIIRRVTTEEPAAKSYRVLAVGPGGFTLQGARIRVDFEPGDVIMADPTKIKHMEVGGQTFLAIAEMFVFGKIRQG